MDALDASMARDRRLRRAVLHRLVLAMENRLPLMGGQWLRDDINASVSADQRFEDEGHVLRICRDLVLKGLAQEMPGKTQRRGERFGLVHVAFCVTDKGCQLDRGQIAVDPDVDDDRMID